MVSDIGEVKAQARKAAFARRKAVHDQERSDQACTHLVEFVRAQAPVPMSGYMPIRTEVDILPAMRALSARQGIGVPVILGEAQPLVFHRWTPETDMVDGPFGAHVPADGIEITPQIIILPLLAFDARGYRLGYGGGFYDRTLEKLKSLGPVQAIGFAYSAQEIDEVPIEATDQRLDAMITDAGVTRF